MKTPKAIREGFVLGGVYAFSQHGISLTVQIIEIRRRTVLVRAVNRNKPFWTAVNTLRVAR